MEGHEYTYYAYEGDSLPDPNSGFPSLDLYNEEPFPEYGYRDENQRENMGLPSGLEGFDVEEAMMGYEENLVVDGNGEQVEEQFEDMISGGNGCDSQGDYIGTQVEVEGQDLHMEDHDHEQEHQYEYLEIDQDTVLPSIEFSQSLSQTQSVPQFHGHGQDLEMDESMGSDTEEGDPEEMQFETQTQIVVSDTQRDSVKDEEADEGLYDAPSPPRPSRAANHPISHHDLHQAMEIDTGDGDDAFVEIQPQWASMEARAKWSQSSFSQSQGLFHFTTIKEEPEDEDEEESRTPVPFARDLAPGNATLRSSELSPRTSAQPTSAPVNNPASGGENTSTTRPPPQLNVQKLLARQKTLAAKMNAKNAPPRQQHVEPAQGPDPQVGSSTTSNPNTHSLSETNTNRRRLSSGIHPNRHADSQILSDPVQVDEAMRNAEDDHTWMEEENGVDVEYERLTRLISLLEKKANSVPLSESEGLELYRARKTVETKDRLRMAARQNSEEQDELFVKDNRKSGGKGEGEGKDKGAHVDDEPEDEDGERGDGQLLRMMRLAIEDADSTPIEAGGKGIKKKRGAKASGTRASRPKNAKEVLEAEAAKERSKASKKPLRKLMLPISKKRRATQRSPSPALKGKGKGKGGKKGKGKKGAVSNGDSLLRVDSGFGKRDGQDRIAQMMLDSLISHDPIDDALQNPAFGNKEPTINGHVTKDTQFKKLFANIPDGNRTQVKNDKARLRDASKSFGYAKVKAQDGKWLIKGMKSTVYHHQLLGAQWMVQRELSSEAPHGGLLADSMGLGKTVQTLACMVGNPPGAEDLKKNIKATLIVVPAAVISQWLDEIRLHTDKKRFPKIMQYKSSMNIPKEVLQDLDIVVTSYNEVMKQFPYPDSEGKKLINKIGYKAWWRKVIEEGLGTLQKIVWFRIVLDEAQIIKNNSSRTSLACQNLKGIYRWCLTGTPLLNKLEELFPYLRFLKANYSMDWNTFQKFFCDPDADDSYSRIATLLSYTMMRRTMKTTILNRPIITLPEPHPEIVYLHFSAEEQIIYRITENRFRININTYFAKGEARKNYGIFMVQLLRLRQCTSHPFMLEKTIKQSWTTEDLEEFKSKMEGLRGSVLGGRPFYEQCKVWVDQSAAEREAARARGEELLPFGRGTFGSSFSMDKALKTVNEEEFFERVICGICGDVPAGAVKTDCGHIFCGECLESYLHEQVGLGGDDYTACPYCSRIFHQTTPIQKPRRHNARSRGSRSRSQRCSQSQDFDQDDDEYDSDTPASTRFKNSAKIPKDSKGRDILGFEPWTTDSTWITKSDSDPSFPLTPSSKLTALKAILLKGFKEAPLDKVVIYIQFRSLARIVGRICASEGWGFLYLTGETTLEHRARVVKTFRDNADVKILIAGLKCGGLGLNFPWASRCISLDLWWNHAVEQQAFGRIFRIGQTKETYMTRLIIRNSVDMRLLGMQVNKLRNIEKAVVGEGEAGTGVGGGVGNTTGGRLGIKELANLFGFLKTRDDTGEVVEVVADYDEEESEGQTHGSGSGETQVSGSGSASASGAFGTGGFDGVEDGYGDVMDLGYF